MFVPVKIIHSTLAAAGSALETNEKLNETDASRCIRDAACEAIEQLLMKLSSELENRREVELSSVIQTLALSASKEASLATATIFQERVVRRKAGA